MEQMTRIWSNPYAAKQMLVEIVDSELMRLCLQMFSVGDTKEVLFTELCQANTNKLAWWPSRSLAGRYGILQRQIG